MAIVFKDLHKLTNIHVVDDAIRFTKHSQDKIIMSIEEQGDKELEEPNYDHSKEELEEERDSESRTTINRIVY